MFRIKITVSFQVFMLAGGVHFEFLSGQTYMIFCRRTSFWYCIRYRNSKLFAVFTTRTVTCIWYHCILLHKSGINLISHKFNVTDIATSHNIYNYNKMFISDSIIDILFDLIASLISLILLLTYLILQLLSLISLMFCLTHLTSHLVWYFVWDIQSSRHLRHKNISSNKL